MNFEVILNDFFMNVSTDSSLHPVENKKIFSLINDFEDGDWRYTNFQNFVWDNIAETSLSKKERDCLVNQSHSLLTAAAKNLRLTDKEQEIGKGSELAEIVLYGIMKHYYDAIPVVPKIFYKQNANDNAKGADSVHIVIGNNDFSLWFGEAKFYNSIEDSRLLNIVHSVKNSLSTDKLKKENSIITNVSDIDLLIQDDNLCNKIKDALSNKNSIDTIKSKINIPILLLHECEITKSISCLTEKYKNSLIDFHKDRASSYFRKQIDEIGSMPLYEKISFHIILFPVPNKTLIVNKFVSNVEHYKGQ